MNEHAEHDALLNSVWHDTGDVFRQGDPTPALAFADWLDEHNLPGGTVFRGLGKVKQGDANTRPHSFGIGTHPDWDIGAFDTLPRINHPSGQWVVGKGYTRGGWDGNQKLADGLYVYVMHEPKDHNAAYRMEFPILLNHQEAMRAAGELPEGSDKDAYLEQVRNVFGDDHTRYSADLNRVLKGESE